MGKERVEKWDILKFVLIFLVVLGHICDGYIGDSPKVRAMFFAIYLFHMPLFIFVSGLFSKRNVDERRYHKIFSFFILFCVTEMAICSFNLLLFHKPQFILLSESGLPWYAFSIFMFELITIALRKFSKRYIFIASILLACFVGYDPEIGDWLTLSRIIVFYPFFFAGYCIPREKLEELFENKKIKIFSAVFLVLLVAGIFWKIDAIYWLRPMLSGRNPFTALGEKEVYGAGIRLIYYVVVFLVCFAVMSLIPRKIGKGQIAKWGGRSMQVYVLHYGFIFLLFGKLQIDGRLSNLPVIGHLYVIPLALVITLICSLKIFEKPFGMLLYPKYRE